MSIKFSNVYNTNCSVHFCKSPSSLIFVMLVLPQSIHSAVSEKWINNSVIQLG